MKELSVSDSVYMDQWIEPARAASNFLVSVRRSGSPTTQLEGIVISRSADYSSKAFGGEMTPITLVIPELQTTMSMKCRPRDIGQLEFGNCKLIGVQPVPLVNRIHPTTLEVTDVGNERVSFQKCDFLKTSMLDIEGFRCSLAFENYCEIECHQLGKRRLASLCLVSGVVPWVQLPSLGLGSVVRGDHSLEMIVSRKVVERQESAGSPLESFVGKYVRILCSAWYGYGTSEARLPKPEIIHIEGIQKEQAVIDDLTGFVRLRQEQSTDQMLARYPEWLSLSQEAMKGIATDTDGMVRWKSVNRSDDAVKKSFMIVNDNLRRRRIRRMQSSGMCQIAHPYMIIDRTKLTFAKLVDRLANDQKLISCFLNIIRTKEDTRELPKSMNALVQMFQDPDSKNNPVRWLRDYGFLLNRQNAGISIDYTGLRIAQTATASRVRAGIENTMSENQTGVLYLGDIENSLQTPPSFILESMKSLEKEGVVNRFEENGRRSDLLWVSSRHTSAVRIACDQKRKLESAVLNVLCVPYALAISKIMENLKSNPQLSSAFIVRLLLLDLLAQGRVEQDKDEFWKYPPRSRLVDALSRTSDSMTLEELMNETGMPVNERSTAEVKMIIQALDASNRITSVPRRLKTAVLFLLAENQEDAFEIKDMINRLSLIDSKENETLFAMLMADLEKLNEVSKLPDGKWTKQFGDDSNRKRRIVGIIKWDCMRYCLNELLTGLVVPAERMEGELRVFQLKISARLGMDPRSLPFNARDLLNELVMDGLIISEKETYRIAGDKR